MARFPLRGLLWGAIAGIAGGGLYGAVLGTGAEPSAGFTGDLLGGFLVGAVYGGPAGAGLGFLAGLATAITTAIRPPRSREGYILFVRTTCLALTAVFATFLAMIGDFSELGSGVNWLILFVPGVIGNVVAWFLAPRAVREVSGHRPARRNPLGA